jgi:hypothetical protein
MSPVTWPFEVAIYAKLDLMAHFPHHRKHKAYALKTYIAASSENHNVAHMTIARQQLGKHVPTHTRKRIQQKRCFLCGRGRDC